MNLKSLLWFAAPAIAEFEATRAKMKEQIKEIEVGYWKACDLPRKKKKAERKRLLYLYSILKYGEKLFDEY